MTTPLDAEAVLLTDGSKVTIRAISADDGPMLQAFVRRLSTRSRRSRFFSTLVELSTVQLRRLVNVDRRRALALVAIAERPGGSAIVAEARCIPDDTAWNAEFAIAVADEFQRQGLATKLMQRLVAFASRTGMQRLYGEILGDNDGMLAFVRRLGFRVRANAADKQTMIASVLRPKLRSASVQP
jgi:acetyltransferase